MAAPPGALDPSGQCRRGDRLGMGQMFYPLNLAVLYPYPGTCDALVSAVDRGSAAARHDSGSLLAGADAAVPGGRLVLVSRHAAAGYWTGGPGGSAIPCRPLYLRA